MKKTKEFLSGIKKGGLRNQLGVPKGSKIPQGVLNKITGGEVGTHVQYRGESIKITPLLKERAVLANNMRKWKKV